MASEARPPPSDLVNSIFKHARARALQQTSPQAPANMPVRLIYHWRSSSQTGTESIPWKIHGTVFPTLIQEKARKDEPSTRRSMDNHGHQRKCGYSGSHGTHGAAKANKSNAQQRLLAKISRALRPSIGAKLEERAFSSIPVWRARQDLLPVTRLCRYGERG